MSSFGKRFVAGTDVWQCPYCKAWNLNAKPCRCGHERFDDVIEAEEKAKGKRTEDKPKKERHRMRAPASEGTFIKSYFFPEKDKDKE